MMRSLFSGVSGLRVHQNRMDVIGNNIANVNTVGFKSSRMTFADAISQRIAGASADNPDTGRAGRNPMQIGLGVNIGGIDNIMTQGAAQRTDRPLDLTIQGDGFFIVSDSSGTFFTRAGNVDWNGRTFSIGGMQLMGWPTVPNPARPGTYVVQPGIVQPLTTPPSVLAMDPRPTSLIEAIGNINPHDAIIDPATNVRSLIRPVSFYDTLGNRYVADVLFEYVPYQNPDGTPNDDSLSDNTRSVWTFRFIYRDAAGEIVDTAVGDNRVTVFPGGIREVNGQFAGIGIGTGMGGDWIAGTGEQEGQQVWSGGDATHGYLVFSPINGRLIGVVYAEGEIDGMVDDYIDNGIRGPQYIDIEFDTENNPLLPPAVIGRRPPVQVAEGGNVGVVRKDFSGLRQQGAPTEFRLLFADGNGPGTLTDVSVGPDGIITGRYSNGHTRPLGQIPLAVFMNPAGLERVGNNLWITTSNSGEFDGVGNHGDMMPGTLEMSNVDLSSEFTEMITTQRGFQANSRVITTSDEMLMELVNLRR